MRFPDKQEYEILAPAGSMLALRAAVSSGANAVYLGLQGFNARERADNFTTANIATWVKYCHNRNVKVYITLNTLVKDIEFDKVSEIIKVCASADVDAFIVQDLAVVKLIQELAPTIPLHASTQMGIHNLEGAKFLEKLGFDRVVLSRETLLSDIEKIKRNTSLELEYFVHGALCVAFSGNCLMSSILNGGSGNRGECLQLCRLPYTVKNDKTSVSGRMLSTSDQMLINCLDELIEKGVYSFKIEGRLRSPEYVRAVVHAYKAKLQEHSVKQADMDEVTIAFNRGGFTKGYNYDSTKQIMSTKFNGNIGLSAGRVISVHSNSVEIRGETMFKRGDGVKFTRGGREVTGGTVEGVSHLKNGSTELNVSCDKSVATGDNVSITFRRSTITDLPECCDDYARTPRRNPNNLTVVNNSNKDTSSEELLAVEINDNRELMYLDFVPNIVVYSPLDYNRFEKIADDIADMNKRVSNGVFLTVPTLLRGKDMQLFRELLDRLSECKFGLYVNNYDGYTLADEYDLAVFAGINMNIVNSVSVGVSMRTVYALLSVELNSKASEYIAEKSRTGVRFFYYALGRTPLMTLTHCPVQLAFGGNCAECKYTESIRYYDKVSFFPLSRRKLKYCQFLLSNGIPTDLTNKLPKRLNAYLDLTCISNTETVSILMGEYKGTITRGRFNKGI